MINLHFHNYKVTTLAARIYRLVREQTRQNENEIPGRTKRRDVIDFVAYTRSYVVPNQ